MNTRLVPHLWYDAQAVEAAEFYCSLFPDSKIIARSVIYDTPSGNCDYLTFELWGQRFEAISAGPNYTFNPSISFMVNFDPLFFQADKDPRQAARDKLDEIWKKLGDGGRVLMELGEYDFSRRYGWIQDKYGLSWQLILSDSRGEARPPIMPSLLFVKENCGRAEEAGNFYLSIFPDSARGIIARYPAGMEPDREGSTMFSDFRLGAIWITATDSAYNHEFQFNEAVSFTIYCNDQEGIDYFWDRLSAVPEAEQCGWLKDKYGVSWQIVPEELSRFLEAGSEKQRQAVTNAVLQMKKIEIGELRGAYASESGD